MRAGSSLGRPSAEAPAPPPEPKPPEGGGVVTPADLTAVAVTENPLGDT